MLLFSYFFGRRKKPELPIATEAQLNLPPGDYALKNGDTLRVRQHFSYVESPLVEDHKHNAASLIRPVPNGSGIVFYWEEEE